MQSRLRTEQDIDEEKRKQVAYEKEDNIAPFSGGNAYPFAERNGRGRNKFHT